MLCGEEFSIRLVVFLVKVKFFAVTNENFKMGLETAVLEVHEVLFV